GQGRLPDRCAGGAAVRGAQLAAVAHQLRRGGAQRAFDPAAFLDRQLAPVPEADSLGDLRALIEHGIPLPDPPSGPFQPRELRQQRAPLPALTAAEPATWEAVLAQMRQASAAYAREFLAALESVFDAR